MSHHVTRRSLFIRRMRGAFAYAEWLRDYLIAEGVPATSIWAMDDSALSTTMVDLLGNHDGTFEGGPTLGADPLVDDDGTSVGMDGVDDYGSVPHAAALNPDTGSFTAIGWVYVPQSQIDGAIDTSLFSKESGTNRYLCRVKGSTGDVRVFFGDGEAEVNRTVGLKVGAHMVGLRADRSTQTFHALLDTGKSGGADISAVGSVSPTSDLSWGSRADAGATDFHNGRIDVGAIIPHALTDAQLQKIYNVGIDRSNR